MSDDKEIPLTKGRVAIVDAADYEWLSQFRWHTVAGSHAFYACRNVPGQLRRQDRILMHRQILGATPGVHVDHINGDGLCNTRDNLRLVSQHENNFNTRLRKDNKSGFKGVTYERGKWRATIALNRVTKFLGYFDSPQEAAIAYDMAARKFFGEFAHTNFE